MSSPDDSQQIAGQSPSEQASEQFRVMPGQMSLPPRAFVSAANHLAEPVPVAANDTVLQGRYRIVGVLGRGGFGAVYRVEDLRLPGKFWALKQLVFEDKSMLAEARRAFEREARMLSTLMHRSLPVVVDYFSEGDSTFLLMQEVDGCTLAQLVEQEGPAKEHEALRWALEIARVLDYMHTQNPPVIFRDLKPENVMITADRHVKLIDFGLARFFDPKKTRDTSVVGSVGYAPPEMWEDVAQTDARSDIYSFGATMYYVLTGKPPSPVYGTHKLQPYRPELSPQFAGLVLRCMEPEPKDRFETAEDLIRELMVLISGSAQDDPLLAEELHARAARTSASALPDRRATPVAVAVAKSVPSRMALNARAARTPWWIPAIFMLTTCLFIAGALLGYKEVKESLPLEYDIPYELVNEDKENARRYIAAKDLPKAAACLDLAITRHPGDAEAHIMRENVGVQMGGGKCLHIPAFMTLSGVDAPEAYRLLYGICLAQADFNKAGGVNGARAVVDIYDDRSDLEAAINNANAIIDDPQYLAIVGPFSSQRTLAMASLLNGKEMPVLAPVVSVPEVWEKGPYVFTASDTNATRVLSIVRYLRKKGCQRAAVMIDQDSLLSAAVAKYFKEGFTKHGGEIVTEQLYTDVRFEAAVDAIGESKADVVFFSDHRGTVLAHFALALRNDGQTIPIASQVAPFTKDLVAIGKDSVEGLLLSGYFHYNANLPKVRAYSQRFRSSFGDIVPSHLDASAYDACTIVFDALKNGAATRQQVRDYLASIGAKHDTNSKALPVYDGVTGKFALARPLDMRTVYLIEIRQGRYELVATEPGPPAPSD